MLRFLIVMAGVLAVGFLCILFCAWRFVRGILEERRQRQLVVLRAYNKRLHAIVERLLARADEIDQEQKYLPVPAGGNNSTRLARACSELVVLGDSLKMLDVLAESGDLRRLRADLLRCCRVAARLARELEAMRG